MNIKLIDFNNVFISNTLKILLKDQSTKKNIIWATDNYNVLDKQLENNNQITENLLKNSNIIQPRVLKKIEEQIVRTKKAEVFTPTWLCNQMNNLLDTEYFGYENVFNTTSKNNWVTNTKKINFPKNKNWQKYVDSKQLEITCGEAPYIVSRYDTTTAEIFPIKKRIGILDRKLRVVNENTDNKNDWLKWTYRAFQSVYGYEFQGDNLIIARINLLITFVDYMQDRWARNPTESELQKVANIIAWNIWQMDGITGKVPFGKPKEERTLNMFDFTVGDNDSEPEEMDCKIFDWTRRRSYTYRSIKEGR